MSSDDKTLFICRAPGCRIPFTNQAGRRNHETTIHTDICDSFKGKKGEVLHFKSKALRDKGKKKIRAEIKIANGAASPTPKKTIKKEPPTPYPGIQSTPAPEDPEPEDITPPPVTAPPATPLERQHSHHNPNPKKKKGFWGEASDWWEGKKSED